jgi:hypothetical protein
MQKNEIPLIIYVDIFLWFAQNSFKKRQVTTCRFSKESRKNLGKLSTNKMKGIKIPKRIVPALPVVKRVPQIQKHLVLSR